MISYKSNNRNKILPKLIKLHNIKLTLKFKIIWIEKKVEKSDLSVRLNTNELNILP